MIGKNKYARLEFTAGKYAGKIVQLKKGEYSLGTHKKCNIRLSGDYVSELHAVLRQNESGLWTLTNNSPNGTYVNQLQVDAVELSESASIQIGAANSIEFSPVSEKIAKSEEPDTKQKNKWTWVAIGIVMIYLPGFVYLQQLGAKLDVAEVEPPVITLVQIERVSQASKKFLNDYSSMSTIDGSGVANAEDSVSLYEQFMRGGFESDAQRNELIDELVERSKTYLTTAHHYVQMELDEQAEKSFRKAITVFPGLSIPYCYSGFQ